MTVGDAFTVSNTIYNLVNGTITPFTVSFDGLTFTFDSEHVTSHVDGNIGLEFLGDLTSDTNGLYSVPTAADFSVTFTEFFAEWRNRCRLLDQLAAKSDADQRAGARDTGDPRCRPVRPGRRPASRASRLNQSCGCGTGSRGRSRQ